jgi:hypothetical protein
VDDTLLVALLVAVLDCDDVAVEEIVVLADEVSEEVPVVVAVVAVFDCVVETVVDTVEVPLEVTEVDALVVSLDVWELVTDELTVDVCVVDGDVTSQP